MNKFEFIETLKKGLRDLPNDEITERISFYSEIIDDRIDEGLSEEEAVEMIGSVDKIIEEIISEMSLSKQVIKKIKPKRKVSVKALIVIILGSPIWLSLLMVIVAILFTIFLSLWSIIVSLWACFVSFIACGLASSILGLIYIFSNNTLPGVFLISVTFVLLGLAVFLYYGSKYCTKWLCIATKKIILGTKRSLVKKEEY